MNYAPLEGSSRTWVTIALSLAVFMQVLDTTIANVAIPTISGNLGASTSQGTWVITSFGVANAISIPITSWLAKRIGEVKLFLWSTLGFVTASWLCGVSTSLEILVFFRVLQGLVAGPIIPLSQSLLLGSYPSDKKHMALALWSMTVIVAPIFGPILGGWISDNWHWSWIFFINVPIGLAAAAISYGILKHRESDIIAQPVDKIGLALLVVGVGSLQIMLDRGKELDWFNSNEIIILGIIAAITLSYLIIWEIYQKNPIVDLSLFRYRNFTVGTVCISIGFLFYFGVVVLLPLIMQTILGYTATQAGIAMAPIGFLPVILSPLIGKYAKYLDMRWIVTISFLTFAACFYWRTTFTTEMDFNWIVWPQFVQGLAVAGFYMPLTTISFAGLNGNQITSASSLSNFFRTLAGSIGTSFTTTLWDRRASVHHVDLGSHISAYDPNTQMGLQQMHQLGLSHQQSLSLINSNINQQAYLISGNEIFWMAAICFIGLIALVWLAKPPFRPADGSDMVDTGGH